MGTVLRESKLSRSWALVSIVPFCKETWANHNALVTSKLTWFIRSKVWISPAPGINSPTDNDPAIDEKLNYAPEILERFKTDPEFLLQYRRGVMNRRIDNFKRTTVTSDAQKKAQEQYRSSMEGRLGNSEKGRKIAQMIIPSFPVGCRRETPGPNLLEALLEPNVDVEWDNIAKITEKGILTKSGEELEFDAIVCATGFDTSFRPRFPIIGKNGVDLADQWDAIPEAYLGLAVPNFPNYFSMLPTCEAAAPVSYQLTRSSIYRTQLPNH